MPSSEFSVTVSLELSTTYVSLPEPPINVSSPLPPSKVLFPELPVRVLSKEFPVPSILPDPVRVKFSTLLEAV